VTPSFWSDEDRLLVSRFGGWSINFKAIARKLGWIKGRAPDAVDRPASHDTQPSSRDERLRQAMERSRFEDG